MTSRERLMIALWRMRRRVSDRAWRQVGPSRERTRFGRTLVRHPTDATPVTDLLYGRIEASAVTEAEALLPPAQRAQLERAEPGDRRRLLLAFAAHEGVQTILDQTGLRADMPPEGVHAMARNAVATGGSPYYADLVADCLEQAGVELAPGAAVLDFGCSSGRVVRVLEAARPELRWHGCDPNPEAIAWGRANLPGIAFEHSSEYRPLPYDDAQFDVVYAISIWSHFSELGALSWAEEMHRIIRPGGHWLVTTQGLHAIAHAAAAHSRWTAQLVEILRDLYEHGFWFAPEFGDSGDHGVHNPDWGFAFMTAEWVLTRLTPTWRVALMHPGRAEGSQDVYVLERV